MYHDLHYKLSACYVCCAKDVRILYTLDFEIQARSSAFNLYLDEREERDRYFFFFREGDNTRLYVFIDNRLYIDALLNQLTILPIIIYGDHETWSDARRTRRTWSQSTIRQDTKTLRSDKVLNNSQFFEYNRVLRVQLGASLCRFQKIT